ncbi:transposase family protein, partial [Thiocystis violacea]|uniref:transposase family protein n=1 Tax=Thiocystis violacea TaxID=13725 RepID=UPI001903D038
MLDPLDHDGAPKLMLSAKQMRSLPAFFADVPDPRRSQGRRHPLPAVLAIAAGAVLCGARGYKA